MLMSSWSLSVPHVSAEDIHPKPNLPTSRTRPTASCKACSDVHARTALIAADLTVLLDLVHHLLREPDGERLLARDLDDSLRPGCIADLARSIAPKTDGWTHLMTAPRQAAPQTPRVCTAARAGPIGRTP